MLVSFQEMPGTSRLWVYQADRKLAEDEAIYVKKEVERFISNWTAHGSDLKASYQLAYRQFIVLALDESFNGATGCGIDASVALVRILESRLNVSFLNNDKVAFMIDKEVQLLPFRSIREKVDDETIEAATKTFDNTVKTLADFNGKWLVESKESWVGRYFK